MLKKENLVAFIDNQQTKEILEFAIQNIGLSNCNVQIGDIEKAVHYIIDNKSPNILIVDITKREVPISDLQNILKVIEPGCMIVVIGESNDVGLYRDMLRMGITDYIVMPITIEFLSNTITTLVEGASEYVALNRKSKDVLFLGAKGGVGLTTVVTNIGYILAKHKYKKTLIIDTDLHKGNCGFAFDMVPTKGFVDILNSPNVIDKEMVERFLIKHNERLMVLSSNEKFKLSAEYNPESIEKILESEAKQFHYILIDMKNNINDTMRKAIEKSQQIFIVMEPNLLSAKEAVKIINLIGKDRRFETFVILNNQNKNKWGEMGVQSLADTIDHKIDFVLPFDNHNPIASLNMGTPLADVDCVMTRELQKIVSIIDFSPEIKISKSMVGKLADSVQNIGQGFEYVEKYPGIEKLSSKIKNIFKKGSKLKEKLPWKLKD